MAARSTPLPPLFSPLFLRASQGKLSCPRPLYLIEGGAEPPKPFPCSLHSSSDALAALPIPFKSFISTPPSGNKCYREWPHPKRFPPLLSFVALSSPPAVKDSTQFRTEQSEPVLFENPLSPPPNLLSFHLYPPSYFPNYIPLLNFHLETPPSHPLPIVSLSPAFRFDGKYACPRGRSGLEFTSGTVGSSCPHPSLPLSYRLAVVRTLEGCRGAEG